MPLSVFSTSLRALRAKLSRNQGANAWALEVEDVIAGLESLIRSAEKDFLSVGGKLMEFLSSSRELHSQLESMVSLVSGEKTQQLCDGLHSVRNWVQSAQERAAQSAQALTDLQNAASLVRRGFATFGQIAMSFHIAAILARIETANLSASQQDLTNLGAEVRSCIDIIELHARYVLDAAKSFETCVAAALRESAKFEAVQKRDLPALLAEVERDLSAIGGQRQDAASASVRMGGDMESVVHHLSALVTSIQRQDIVRQQFEHIVEALRDLLQGRDDSASAPNAASVLKLQRLQLVSAAATFSQATANIEVDLETLEKKVGDMASASRSILGDGDNHSFLTQLQSRLAAISAGIQQVNSTEAGRGKTFADLESIGKQLRDAVKEVQSVEVQLSRIAINAAVSACHLGPPGDPLNVVAGAIQTLQNECASRSREAETALISIGTATDALASHQIACLSDKTIETFAAGAANLRAAHASSLADTSLVTVRANKLCEGLRQARQNFTIGKAFDENVGGFIATMARLASRTGSAAPASSVPMHALQYTMRSEREVHRAAAGEAPLAQTEPQEQEVEFF